MRPLYLALLALGCSSPALAAPAPPPPSLRPPAGVHPLRYALDLTIVPSAPRFSGVVTIDLAIDNPTSVVWLDGSGLTVDSAEFHAANGTDPARVIPGGEDFIGFALEESLDSVKSCEESLARSRAGITAFLAGY